MPESNELTFDTSTDAHTEHPTEEVTIDDTAVDPNDYHDNSMEFVQFAKKGPEIAHNQGKDDNISESEEWGKANADSDSIESYEEENENKKESKGISKKFKNSRGFKDRINRDDKSIESEES